jgi:cell division protein FtsB
MKLKLIVGAVVLLILGFTVFGERGLLNLIRYKRESRELVVEAERLREENERLKAEVERLKSDLSYVERLAREELGMVKPGEIVIQFTDVDGPSKGAP